MFYNPPFIEEMPVRKVSKVISIKENPVSTAPAETSCESAAENVGMVPQRGLGGCPAADVHPVLSAPVRDEPPATPLFPCAWDSYLSGNF